MHGHCLCMRRCCKTPERVNEHRRQLQVVAVGRARRTSDTGRCAHDGGGRLTWPGHRHANQHHISADQWTCAARAHRRASSWACWLFENSSATSDAMTAQKGWPHSPHVTECGEGARPTRGMRAAEEMRHNLASAAFFPIRPRFVTAAVTTRRMDRRATLPRLGVGE